jgi:hypothetical protein
MASELLCQSCREQKLTLRKVRSALIKSMDILMCMTCIDKKYEPRYLIILSIRSIGLSDSTKKIIHERRYLGEEISAADIL